MQIGLTIRQLEEILGICKAIINRILVEGLKMNRLVSRWVSKPLTDENKRQKVDDCRKLLKSGREEKDFLDRRVTTDESWFHYYEPETIFQSSQWKRSHDIAQPSISAKNPPERERPVNSGIERAPEKTTINSDYHITELEELLREVIKRERRGKLSRNVILQHHNAKPHVSVLTSNAIRHLGFECLQHPAYSPELVQSDYWLFGDM